MQGFCLERKYRGHGRAGGVACYIRNDLMYKRWNDMEVHDLEVMWIKVMPKKTPRKFSCILVTCLYYTPKTEYLKIRDHLITNIDTVITGGFNQLRDNFMKTHYRFVQVVNVVTRGQAILDKMWRRCTPRLLLFPNWGHRTITWFCLNLKRKTQLILDA
ncbi:hypothetical protein NP493_197g01018 [Ridgeia piscesae]|uniref:Uncharacterized protein n=1 Tax=Ridgeia piscesae TaxID=27915 RepID=A0AAD9P1V3_RIDPI|nr:hypothetical protein NP493_197g01018 [Ridgeia piscesae]